MLKLTITSPEGYDEKTEMFIESESYILTFEHSLVSLSKWESLWHKPFLLKGDKTPEESISYIKCMTIDQDIDDHVYEYLTSANVDIIKKYIEDPATATTFSKTNHPPNNQIFTSELFYFLMTSYNIPFECETWHLNRLITLIKLCELKNNPPKKPNSKETMSSNKARNLARRQASNSSG